MAAPNDSQEAKPATDLGLSHIALSVRNCEESVEFYARFAGMREVHRRGEPGKQIVWLSDLERPFVLVLIEVDSVAARLEGIAHLGVACASREQVDRLSELAHGEDRLAVGPQDGREPMGYWALLRDPDGHNLEISHGQQVGTAIEDARAGGQTQQGEVRQLTRRAARPRRDPPSAFSPWVA